MQLSVLIMNASDDVAALLPKAVGACDVRRVRSVAEARSVLDEAPVHVLVAREGEGGGLLQQVQQSRYDVVCIGIRDESGEGQGGAWSTLTEPVSVEALRCAIERGPRRVSELPRMVVVDEGGGHDLPGTHHHYEPRRTDIEQLLSGPAEGLVVVHTSPENAQALLRDLRRDPEGARLHVVACSAAEQPRAKSALWSAGADEVWAGDSPSEALAARVHHRWETISRLSVVPPPSRDGVAGLLESGGWQEMPEVLARNLSDFVGAAVTVAEPGAWPTQFSHISLVEVDAQLEVHAVIGGHQEGLRDLVALLFGEEGDEELLPDLLRELANVAMGAMKSRWIEDGFAFTSGLPIDGRRADQTVPGASKDVASMCFRLLADAFEVEVLLRIHPCEHRSVAATDLRERMVLAEDVRGLGGALIAAAGTRLTAGMVESIRGLVPAPSVLVSVPQAPLGADT